MLRKYIWKTTILSVLFSILVVAGCGERSEQAQPETGQAIQQRRPPRRPGPARMQQRQQEQQDPDATEETE